MTIETVGLERLDIHLDDRPQRSIDLDTNGTGNARLAPAVPIGALLRLTGYLHATDKTPAALYRGEVS